MHRPSYNSQSRCYKQIMTLARPSLLMALLLTACDTPTVVSPEMAVDAGDAASGQRYFLRSCSECHGSDALGTDQGPPLIHRIYEPSHHADISFVMAAKQGVRQHHWPFGDMPPRPEVTDAEIRDIIAWVRREQRKAGIH